MDQLEEAKKYVEMAEGGEDESPVFYALSSLAHALIAFVEELKEERGGEGQ